MRERNFQGITLLELKDVEPIFLHVCLELDSAHSLIELHILDCINILKIVKIATESHLYGFKIDLDIFCLAGHVLERELRLKLHIKCKIRYFNILCQCNISTGFIINLILYCFIHIYRAILYISVDACNLCNIKTQQCQVSLRKISIKTYCTAINTIFLGLFSFFVYCKSKYLRELDLETDFLITVIQYLRISDGHTHKCTFSIGFRTKFNTVDSLNLFWQLVTEVTSHLTLTGSNPLLLYGIIQSTIGEK